MKKSEAKARLIGYLMDQESQSNTKLNVNKGVLVDFLLDCVERLDMVPMGEYKIDCYTCGCGHDHEWEPEEE